jgi:hypothetical protein
MLDNKNERERQERAVYLHEAGHAVAAIHYRKTINEVFCDGLTGHVDATDNEEILKERKRIKEAYNQAAADTKKELIGVICDAYEGE